METETATEPQFNSERRRRVLELLEALPWGDMELARLTLEESLRLAIEATTAEFVKWEEEAEPGRFQDEFSLSPEQVAGLSPEWRLAYVGRLVRSLALVYGVSPELSRGDVAGEDTSSPAGLLRGIDRILSTPSKSG